jgi:hypothetical protein
MLSLQCPVCRAPVSRLATFVRPAGMHKWRCDGCGSLIGISLVRRWLMCIPMAGAMLGCLMGARALALPGSVGTAGAVVSIVLFCFVIDRMRVYERCGVCCRGCGYDLRGQQSNTCPECGETIGEAERELLERLAAGAALPTTAYRPSKLVIGTVIFLIVTMSVVSILGMTYAHRQRVRAQLARPTQRITQTLIAHAAASGGVMPGQFLECIDGRRLRASDFFAAQTSTATGQPIFAGLTADRFDALTADERAALLAETNLSGAGARIGDYVLTSFGVGADAPAGTWLVIMWPDPAWNGTPDGSELIAAGRKDGGVDLIRARDFDERLEAQNDLRRAAGLAPVAHPARE